VRTLERALRIIGNEETLAELLWLSPARLRRLLSGEARTPDDIFLKAADIVFNDSRTRDIVRKTAHVVSATVATLDKTKALLAEAAALCEASRASGFQHRLFDADYWPKDRRDVLQTGLDAALQAASTDRGDIELADAQGALHIAVWQGLPDEFLKLNGGISDHGSACRLAFTEHKRIVVTDVTSDPLYVDTPALEALRKAGIRALCATPLVAPTGEALGIVSTHFHDPTVPDAKQLAMLELVARGTATCLQALSQ
jgi:hypothetical protein